MDKYPGNSKFTEEDKETKPKVEQITKGKVKKQKKSFGRKLSETFIDEDTDNVWEYLVSDVLIPSIKSTVSDLINIGVDMLLFGENRQPSNMSRRGGRTHVNYSNIYYSDGRRKPQTQYNSPQRVVSQRTRANHSFDDILFEDRGEAEQVLSSLVEMIDVYGQTTVADLYDLVGVTSNFTDQKYGWTTLAKARVDRVRGGYLLMLPRTEVID